MVKGSASTSWTITFLAMYPLECVHMDYLTIENPKWGNDSNVLVITDHYTWYAKAIVTSFQTAWVTAQAF